MRRPLLLTLIAVGSLVVLIGGTGLFAALTDTARTGTNQVDSAALAASADIRLSTATTEGSAVQCGTPTDDLLTGFFTASDVVAGYTSNAVFFCITNVGSQPVSISASVDTLSDRDTTCTGDEELHGDTTCGGDLLGELSTVLRVYYERVGCSTGFLGGQTAVILKDNVATAVPFAGSQAPGETGCYRVLIDYPAWHTATDVQKAQSDRVTWRFKFTAQV